MKMEFHSWLVRAHPTTETLSSIYYFSSKMIHQQAFSGLCIQILVVSSATPEPPVNSLGGTNHQ